MFTVCELRFSDIENFAEATDGKVKVAVANSDYSGDYMFFTDERCEEHRFDLTFKAWTRGVPPTWKEDYFKVADQLHALLAKGPQPL